MYNYRWSFERVYLPTMFFSKLRFPGSDTIWPEENAELNVSVCGEFDVVNHSLLTEKLDLNDLHTQFSVNRKVSSERPIIRDSRVCDKD